MEPWTSGVWRHPPLTVRLMLVDMWRWSGDGVLPEISQALIRVPCNQRVERVTDIKRATYTEHVSLFEQQTHQRTSCQLPGAASRCCDVRGHPTPIMAYAECQVVCCFLRCVRHLRVARTHMEGCVLRNVCLLFQHLELAIPTAWPSLCDPCNSCLSLRSEAFGILYPKRRSTPTRQRLGHQDTKLPTIRSRLLEEQAQLSAPICAGPPPSLRPALRPVTRGHRC